MILKCWLIFCRFFVAVHSPSIPMGGRKGERGEEGKESREGGGEGGGGKGRGEEGHSVLR